MHTTNQVRKPSYVRQGGKYGFFALIRSKAYRTSAIQKTKYHSLGGYLCRANIRPSLENPGESMAVYLNYEGPDASGVATPARITPYWNILTRCEISLVHPNSWEALGIKHEDVFGQEENVSRVCSCELGEILGPNSPYFTRILACGTNAPDVEICQGYGYCNFVPYAAVQNGLFGDRVGNFVLHFAVYFHTEFDDNEINTGYAGDCDLNEANPNSKAEGEMFSDALNQRAQITDRIIQYDHKLKSLENKVILGIVRKEIEFLSETVTRIPEIGDFV